MRIRQRDVERRSGSVPPPVDRKLRFRLRILAAIALVMLVIVIFRVLQDRLAVEWATLAVAAGIFAGAIVSRMYRLSWNDEARMVVGRVDMIGGVILALYIVFAIERGRIIGHWVRDASEASTIGLGLTSGVMAGGVLCLAYGIRRLLFATGIR